MANKNFIVPHDFSAVADCALLHAQITAKVVKAKVYVLHVVSKEKDIKKAEIKLHKILQDKKEDGVELVPKVRVGNIFDDIGEFAAEHHGELIFMGTHGPSGWQHIGGLHALKVVTNSNIPFVIVQKKNINVDGYNDIVVPLDLHRETKQKLAIVASMAEYFKSRVHVITPKETDEFLKNKVRANILFAERFFGERNIEMTSKLANPSGFDKEIVRFAVEKDADLIAIMNQQKSTILSFGAYEEYIITNDAQIPALVVNPLDTPYGESVLFT